MSLVIVIFMCLVNCTTIHEEHVSIFKAHLNALIFAQAKKYLLKDFFFFWYFVLNKLEVPNDVQKIKSNNMHLP